MRPIDADALLERAIPMGWSTPLWVSVIAIKDAPTLDVVERKKGKWVRNENGAWSCSLCHSWIPNEQHYYARYCLHCGAELINPLGFLRNQL